MRLEAQAKGGYYPASPEAIRHVLKNVKPMKASPIVFDPCCGEGLALREVGRVLKCRPNCLYGVELETDRAEAAKTLLPAAHILQCSYFEVDAGRGTFGVAWVNPPFDDAMGGGDRVEHQFLEKVTPQLTRGGILVFICPEAVSESTGVRYHFLQNYDAIDVVPFPEGHRPYNEVAVIGRRKDKLYEKTWIRWENNVGLDGENPIGTRYAPSGFHPRQFKRVFLPKEEIISMAWNSPLRDHYIQVDEPPIASPPLALSVTHYALLLAAGHLDGLVKPEGETPHVVRGTAKKEEYIASESEEEQDDGSVVKTVIKQERVILTVRALWPDAEIKTYTQKTEKKNDGGT
jgi:hypothetical protein